MTIEHYASKCGTATMLHTKIFAAALVFTAATAHSGRAGDVAQRGREVPKNFFDAIVWSGSTHGTGEPVPNQRELLQGAMQEKARQAGAQTREPPVASGSPSSGVRPAVDVRRLLARGRTLSAAGDIAGARLLFQHAASSNDPAALHALAETYDPAVLMGWRVLGHLADPEKARSLYEQASFEKMKLAQARLTDVMHSLGNSGVIFKSRARSPDQ